MIASSLAGCGFQLQGKAPLPATFANTYVESGDVQSDFVQSLRRSLLGAGVKVARRAEGSSAVVRVIDDRLEERVLSVSGTNAPREYELVYTVKFAVTSDGRELVAPEEVSATREFSFDERILLAKEREKELLGEALARDLVGIVMRRLASL